MEQQKISARVILKLTVSTLWVHRWLYAQIAACAIGVMLAAPYLKQYIEGTEFIPLGHLDTISQIIFEYLLKFWFWGACVVIAVHIIRTGHAYFSDFIRSLKYAPSFIIIQIIIALPMLLVGQLIPIIKLALLPPADSAPITPQYIAAYWATALIILPIFTFFACAWQLYGQLAVPIFVIEKKGILKSLTASLHRGNKLIWKIIELNLTWMLLVLVITGILSATGYVLTGNGLQFFATTTPFTGFDVLFLYPFLALAYVYLYTQSRRSPEANN